MADSSSFAPCPSTPTTTISASTRPGDEAADQRLRLLVALGLDRALALDRPPRANENHAVEGLEDAADRLRREVALELVPQGPVAAGRELEAERLAQRLEVRRACEVGELGNGGEPAGDEVDVDGKRERGDVRRRRQAGVLERPVDVVIEARVALPEVHDRDALLREPPGHDRLVRLVHELAHGLVLLLEPVAPSLGLLELPVEVVQLGLLDVRRRLLEVAAAGDGDADHDADREGDEDRGERGDVVAEIEHAGLAFRGHEESWR